MALPPEASRVVDGADEVGMTLVTAAPPAWEPKSAVAELDVSSPPPPTHQGRRRPGAAVAADDASAAAVALGATRRAFVEALVVHVNPAAGLPPGIDAHWGTLFTAAAAATEPPPPLLAVAPVGGGPVGGGSGGGGCGGTAATATGGVGPGATLPACLLEFVASRLGAWEAAACSAYTRYRAGTLSAFIIFLPGCAVRWTRTPHGPGGTSPGDLYTVLSGASRSVLAALATGGVGAEAPAAAAPAASTAAGTLPGEGAPAAAVAGGGAAIVRAVQTLHAAVLAAAATPRGAGGNVPPIRTPGRFAGAAAAAAAVAPPV